MEEPSLLREIGKVAWLVAKVVGTTLAILTMLIPLFRWNPMAGYIGLYSLMFGGQIVFAGYSTYKSKMKDFEWNRKFEIDRIKWEEAAKRLRGDKTA